MVKQHFLIVGLDGLRADMVTPELTPNLLRMARQGVMFQHHHAVFPSATRVNVTSLVTGVNSGTHGIVNNSMFEPGVSPDKPVDLGKYDMVEAADAYYQGALLGTPSLGEILAAHGETMVAISAGTTGSNRLMHHKVKTLGGIGFSVQGIAPSYPTGEAQAIVARFGAAPAAGTPDSSRLAYVTDVCLEHLFPRYQPQVTILWFSDPDKTYHYCGIGSPASYQAIRAADAQMGRILDWLQQPEQRDRFTLMVLSDHGHVTVRQQVSVSTALSAIGVTVGNGYYSDQGVAVVPSYSGAIHVRHNAPHLVRKIVAWMQEQPWCGAVFTQGKNAIEGIIPGTFARSLVLNDHPRSGDIVYVMRTDEEPNAHGFAGNCYDDSSLPIGGSTHGGLSPYELHNVCAAYGPAFREGYASAIPSGTIDVLPTLLHLLGYPIPSQVEGRILSEALRQPADTSGAAPVTQTYSTEAATPAGIYRQHLTFTRVGNTTYLERGWVE
jgi:arylsulfatase A-like enzyme